jgi:threonine dehydrogenase-like Zn-dependent dehydrogenase
MRAVVLRHGELTFAELPEPRPGPGQLLVEPIATGICGSDLSAREHTAEFLSGHELAGAHHSLFDPARDLVMGHEFTSRVLEVGGGVDGYTVGDHLVTLPVAVDAAGAHHTVGYSTRFPGGLAERVVVQAHGHLKIPPGVSPYTAAVTEPMATGLNGVLRSHIEVPTGALVTGCGPVGLGAIVELSQHGIHPIVASDPAPVRRRAATALGADEVVDPLEADPSHVWRDLADKNQRLYVYEASGKRGILETLIDTLPPHTRIYVVGTCMTQDSFKPLVAMLKNIAIDYVTGPAYGETEYHALTAMFRHICRGRFDPETVVTGYTGLEGVPALFDLLRPQDPHEISHVKVLVRRDLTGPGITTATLARRSRDGGGADAGPVGCSHP